MAATLEVTISSVVQNNNDTVNFTSVNVDDAAETVTISLRNTGDENLTIYVENIKSGFELVSPPASTLATAGTTNLVLSSYTGNPGDFERILEIKTNDPLALTFRLNLSISISSEEIAYTTRALLDRRFGYENIEIWGDLNGSKNFNEIETAVRQAILDVSREIDTYLDYGHYEVPFETAPALVEQIACDMAAYQLYVTKGLYSDRLDKQIGGTHRRAMKALDEIRHGKLKLLGTTDTLSKTTPFVGEE